MYYREVFKALNRAKVKYVVVGGVAVVLHGYERMTMDLDLIVFLEENNLDKMFEALKKIKYSPKVPVTKEQFVDKKERNAWKKEKGMIVFSFCQNKPPFHIVDMLIDEPIAFEKIYRKKTNVKIDNITIPLISIDHLKKLKEIAGRPQDLMDIVQLEAIKKENKK